MKRTTMVLLVFCITLVTILLVTSLPFVTASLYDKSIIGKEVRIGDEPIEIKEKSKLPSLTLTEKIKMAWNYANMERIYLKEGEILTYQDAFVLCRMEIMQLLSGRRDNSLVNIDVPDLRPVLYIDRAEPTNIMMVWTGLISINGVLYQILLDEESQKILFIQTIDEYRGGTDQYNIMGLWKNYISN